MPGSNEIRILIVEDEPSQQELLRYNLEKQGFGVLIAGDGEEGLLLAEEELPDLILLDWMLPKLSGIELCRQFKRNSHTREIPVIMLTARGEESDRVRGLETGADDYQIKPYSIGELIARIRALLRRTRPDAAGEPLAYGDITLDPRQHKVRRSGQMLHLGPTEFRLLAALMQRPERVWSREQILDRVWGRESEIDFRAVDVHIGRLRKALALPGRPDPIRTVRGAGYALDLAGTERSGQE
jgi:two-component system phosphate regulon response regulator PhoB